MTVINKMQESFLPSQAITRHGDPRCFGQATPGAKK